jgi:hypothetical protein
MDRRTKVELFEEIRRGFAAGDTRANTITPAKGNEKGGFEGELGWYRRN